MTNFEKFQLWWRDAEVLDSFVETAWAAWEHQDARIAELEAQLAQSDRQPVAWRIQGIGYDSVTFHEPLPLVDYLAGHTVTPLYK